jgi:hypothetical protein
MESAYIVVAKKTPPCFTNHRYRLKHGTRAGQQESLVHARIASKKVSIKSYKSDKTP